jgi:hypothetical protein
MLICLFVILPEYCKAQLPSSVIEIQGRVLQHGTQHTTPLSNIEVWVNNKAYISDKSGNFSLKIPFSEERIKLNIQPNGYRILKPFKGEILLDPAVTVFQLEIFVIQQNADEALVKTVSSLESKLAQSQRNYHFNQRQLNRINEILLDTLVFFDKQQQAFIEEIEDLHAELELSRASVNELEQRLHAVESKLAASQQQVDLLSTQLYTALEEKYLRQQDAFDQISTALNDYLLRLKDINDVMISLNDYFPVNYSPSGSASYNAAVEAYNEVFSLLNGKKDDFLLSVDHYWESRNISEELATTFNFLFDDIHQTKLLPALTEINSNLRQQKRKAAINMGTQAAQMIKPQINHLEIAIKKSLLLIKNNI